MNAISTWKSALHFWVNYTASAIPDLITADVRFELDTTSPLVRSLIGTANNLPTGLSHVKPFAAIARVAGMPIGVGIHTADAQLWSRLIYSENPTDQIMAYLAAHEIGEVAAILGHSEAVLNGSSESLDPLWNWLIDNSADSPTDALRKAVRSYRRRLLELSSPLRGQVEIFIMPDEWSRVSSWCSGMQTRPRPLSLQNDGLMLTYRNGRSDYISLASLFADVDAVTTRTLDTRCFEIPSAGDTPGTDPADLDYKRRPAIGAFLARLNTLEEVYGRAKACLRESFSADPTDEAPSYNLRTQIKDGASAPLARGLAVILQLLKIEKEKYDVWLRRFEGIGWVRRECCFLISSSRTLKSDLESLMRAIRDVPAEKQSSMSREDILASGWEKTSEEDANEKWVKWHFEILIAAKILVPQPDGMYELKSKTRRIEAPRLPPNFPGQRTTEKALELPARKNWLVESLGFHRNFNAIGEILYDAFIHKGAKNSKEKPKLGRLFFDQVLKGKAPTWLLKLCEQFALDELGWKDRSAWPKWLLPEESQT